MCGVVSVLCAVMRYCGGVMEDIREWLALVWQWVLVVWQWLIVGWQWLLAWPWSDWLGMVQAALGHGWVTAGVGLVSVRAFLSSADGWDILGNVATVLATLWLVSLGREFVAQGRWTILAGLYEHMEEVHRQIMTLQKKSPSSEKDFAELVELRNQMKNYFHNSRYVFVKDQRLYAEIESAVNQYGGDVRDYKKTNDQYQKLRTLLEELIHQRTGIERVFHFVFIGMWVNMWRWVWRPRTKRSVK